MEDDFSTYTRDDGTVVPIAECTREELLIGHGQLVRALATKDSIIKLLKVDKAASRREAMEEAAGALLRLR